MTPGKNSDRVFILTAGFGEGHNAAARALGAAFADRSGADGVKVLDPFALLSPRLNALLRRLYLTVINDAPLQWSRVYRWIDHSSFPRRQLWLFRREIKLLTQLIIEERPRAICCTYPLYAFLLKEISRRGVRLPPVYNVVTDSISIHSLWWRAPCTGWFLPNADSAGVLLKAGIDAAAIHVYGFPVPAFFALNASTLSPPDLMAGGRPSVLHIINSGTQNAAETARLLLAQENWDITCAVGRDEKLRAHLLRTAAQRARPAKILGWTDQIPKLLMTHHAVVSKAGGATTQEAIAALCPMIVNQIVPGQEEGNYELLRRHGAGALATTPAAVIAALQRAFTYDGRVWREWRSALRPLARVDAADEIASRVLASLPSGEPGSQFTASLPAAKTVRENAHRTPPLHP